MWSLYLGIGYSLCLSAKGAKTAQTLSTKDRLSGTAFSGNPGDWLCLWWSLMLLVMDYTSKGRLWSQQGDNNVRVRRWLSLKKTILAVQCTFS